MKNTGIVRKIDALGRMVLPVELRRTLDIAIGDSLEIFVDGDTVVLKKYHPACIFCNESSDTITFKGRRVCKPCRRDIEGYKHF